MVARLFVVVLLVVGASVGFCLNVESEESALIKVGKATFTYFNSYPMCCPESPNFDPEAAPEECDNFSGCAHMGDLMAMQSAMNPNGHVELSYIQSHNLVSFYDDSDPHGLLWRSRYANKAIQITKAYNGMTRIFNATIVDTCSNLDCNNCCSKNARASGGFLLNMEYYTVVRHFGTTDAASGTAAFVIV